MNVRHNARLTIGTVDDPEERGRDGGAVSKKDDGFPCVGGGMQHLAQQGSLFVGHRGFWLMEHYKAPSIEW